MLRRQLRKNVSKMWLGLAVLLLVAGVGFVLGLKHGGGADANASGGRIYAAKLVEGDAGWALTGTGLSWTEDAGHSWRGIDPRAGIAHSIREVAFANAESGVVVATSGQAPHGAFVVYRTSDSGGLWSESSLPGQLATGGSVSADLVDPRHGWILIGEPALGVRPSGALFTTSDGGETWTELPKPPAVGDISFVDDANGWLAGGEGGHELYRTNDGGQSWSRVQVKSVPGFGEQGLSYGLPELSSDGSGLLPVTFDGGRGQAAVGLYLTSDGGSDWALISLTPLKGSIGPGVDPKDAVFAGPDSLVIQDPGAPGLTTVSAAATVKAAAQGGSAQPPPAPSTRSLAAAGLPLLAPGLTFYPNLSFSDTQTGFALADSENCEVQGNEQKCAAVNELLSTENGGQTWAPTTPP